MDRTVRAPLLFLAFFALTAALYLTRDLLAPLALAIFIWLIIDAFARWIDNLSNKIPYWVGLIVAILTVLAGLLGIILIIADTAADVARESARYEVRVNEIFIWVEKVLPGDDDFSSLNERFGVTEKVTRSLVGFAASVQGVVSNFFLILIYVAFLFAAQSSFPKKMDDLFPDVNRRAQASQVAVRIRHSIEKYLGVQTIISLMQTVISYAVMASLGLDNALFWALVIFILNYIPIVGGPAAIVLPVMFALVQYDSMMPVVILAGGLFGVQVVIGNTIQPKMMGDSMNLSALVVVLSLTMWYALWGGVGALLSAPLTVIIMIILAQFPTTRWIAVLLSADGQPDMDPDEKKKHAAKPAM